MAAITFQRDVAKSVGGMKSAPLMTVAEVRRAAAGDIELQGRLVRALIEPGRDLMFTGAAEWCVTAVKGPRNYNRSWSLGWPASWLTSTEYATIRYSPEPGRTELKEWRWYDPLTLQYTHVPAAAFGISQPPARALRIELWSVPLVLLTGAIAGLVLLLVARRRKRSCWLMTLAVMAGPMLLLIPNWEEQLGYGAVRTAVNGPTMMQTRIDLRAPDGQANLVRKVAKQIEGANDAFLAVVTWTLPSSINVVSTGIGWPRQWINVSTYGEVPEELRAGEFQGLRFERGIFRYRWIDRGGRLVSVTVPMRSLAVTAFLILLGALTPYWLSSALRRRRERRMLREGRCLSCGYAVAG
jgi:hypothetical protein